MQDNTGVGASGREKHIHEYPPTGIDHGLDNVLYLALGEKIANLHYSDTEMMSTIILAF